MEILITIFLGAWVSAGCFLAYRRLKREFQDETGRERGR